MEVSNKLFEAHITIEPLATNELQNKFGFLCAQFKFRPAKLLMQKERSETLERSDKDAFCTGHDTSYEEIMVRGMSLVGTLKLNGFKVWRFKIEQVLFDVRNP